MPALAALRPLDSPILQGYNNPPPLRFSRIAGMLPMQLSSADRPKLGNGLPTILLDGSVVPQISVWPLSDTTVRIGVMLRNYKSGESFAYAWHTAIIEVQDLQAVMVSYYTDPEATILKHFGWTPKKNFVRHTAVAPSTFRPKIIVPPSPELTEMIDLL